MAKKYSNKKWSIEEIDIILKFGNELTDSDLHKLIGNHTITAICSKRKKLGIKFGNDRWTKDDELFLASHVHCSIDELLVLFPNRTKCAIYKKILSNKIRSPLKTMIFWSKLEDEILFQNGGNLSNIELAKFFKDRTPDAIAGRCFKLKIHKTHECKSRLSVEARRCVEPDALRKLNQNITLDNLDNTTYQVLIGSMLGDGCITKGRKSVAYHFNEGHGYKQKHYVLWKKDKLCLFEPISYGNQISTPCHSIFTNLRKLFYPSIGDKNSIDLSLIERLDMFGLMVWYLDDGYLGRPKSGVKNNGKHRRTYPHICCKGYSLNNLNNVCSILNKNHGLSLVVNTSKHRDGWNKHIILNRDKNDIFQIWHKLAITTNIPLCMHYKLNMHNGTQWTNEPIRGHKHAS